MIRPGLLAVAAWLVLPSVGLGQALVPVEDPAERLDRWLALQRDDVHFARHLAGPVSVGAGALMIGAGVYGLADDPYGADPNVAWLQVSVGALGVAQGIVWLLIQPDPELRYARWRAARAGGLADRELHRFEGELRAYPFVAQSQRALYRWSGLGLLFGGGVTLGALAAQSGLPERHAIVGWTTAGLYTGLGALLLVASLWPAFGERAFERYEEGLAPALGSLRVEPAGFEGGGGVAVTGTF